MTTFCKDILGIIVSKLNWTNNNDCRLVCNDWAKWIKPRKPTEQDLVIIKKYAQRWIIGAMYGDMKFKNHWHNVYNTVGPIQLNTLGTGNVFEITVFSRNKCLVDLEYMGININRIPEYVRVKKRIHKFVFPPIGKLNTYECYRLIPELFLTVSEPDYKIRIKYCTYDPCKPTPNEQGHGPTIHPKRIQHKPTKEIWDNFRLSNLEKEFKTLEQTDINWSEFLKQKNLPTFEDYLEYIVNPHNITYEEFIKKKGLHLLDE
jgi:hypothetical protein